MKKFLAVIIIGLINTTYSQSTICVGDDIQPCINTSITINDCLNFGGGSSTVNEPYVIQQLPFSPDPFNSGTSIDLDDDDVTNAIPIGFPFCFWGNTYTQFYIGSNGWISFSSGQPDTYASLSIPSTNSDIPKNCIMGPWQDWHPGTGPNVGNYIKYKLYGVAPNRRLVVSWNQVPMFSCTSTFGTFQIVLFEGSNNIETRIQNKPNCLTWADGTATHGMHNINGTQAYTIPNRNSTQWITSNETYLFEPGNFGIVWKNTLGQTFPYNGGTLNLTASTPGNVGYFVEATEGCGGTISYSDTSWISVTTVNATTSTTPDICNTSQGSVTVNPTSGVSPFTFIWTPSGSTSPTLYNVPGGTYSVQVSDANGCSITKSATVANTNANYNVTSTKVSCPGGSDGTATATMTPNIGNVSYLWSDGQTTATATNLVAGSYTVNVSSDAGCSQTLTVEVTEIPGMDASVTSFTDVTCNSHSDGTVIINVSQGTAPYTFNWDQSSSTTSSANDLSAGQHNIFISDLNGCSIQLTQIIQEPAPLNISFLSPDTQICPENSIELVVNGTGGSSTYMYSWSSNGIILSNDSSVVVDPEFSNTDYCVTFSEICGSPDVTECVTLTFPTPIIPSILPDTTTLCSPGTFFFENNSSNGGEIEYSHFAFDDQAVALREGNDTISHTFRDPGFHTVILTTTSIYGCVYKDTFTDIVNVLPIPVADFNFSTNPTTIFETVIVCQDRSTSDVIDWQWISEDSYPSSSALQNPKFEFPDGETGQYPVTLFVTTENNCFDSITKVLHVIEDVLFFAPNSFTPDDDEFNQSWSFYASGIDIYQFEIQIINRWGEIIWESHDPEADWDGTFNGRPVPSGTYIWIATTKSVRNDEKLNFSGTISLLR